MDHRPELWDAPLIITEGGGSDFAVGDQRFYTCQTGQKGICRFRARTTSPPATSAPQTQDDRSRDTLSADWP